MKPLMTLALIALPTLAVAAERLSPRAQTWWNDIAYMADDKTEGRQTGSDGYMLAARYVIDRFKAEGLRPAGDHGGFLQEVAFEEQIIDQPGSTAVLIGPDGKEHALNVGQDLLISAGGAPRPTSVDAPLVFIGYGLHLPEQGWDDYKGLDLKGKIVVILSGGPSTLPGPLKSSMRNQSARLLHEAGALGMIQLTAPKQVEIPWSRLKLLAPQAGMYLAEKSLRETPDGMLAASVNPELAQILFEGSGHSFEELAALSDASKPLPTFDLPLRLRAQIKASHRRLTSPNILAKLEGSDPKLAAEYVVLSAHLDHIGVGAPINGDKIYNGAMDDASGVASVLDMAHVLASGPRPKRSILFAIVTAEEKGLLGSHYFAERPTVPAHAIVADLNLDMPLPLWPFKSVTVQGEAESTLGAKARAVAARQGVAIAPDPLPDRNSFVRTDQYSFVKAGVPSLAFKFGFAKGTPEFQIEHDWRANRYHAPSDDVNQPGVLQEEAVKLDDLVAGIALDVANDPTRPTWLETSPFKRFAKER